MTKSRRKVVRYSISFKHQVVNEFESGASISSLMRKYGIKGGETVRRWLITYGKRHLLNQVIRVETMDEADRTKALEQELRNLKLILADSLIAQRLLEEVITLGNEHYQTDLKKVLVRMCPASAAPSGIEFLVWVFWVWPAGILRPAFGAWQDCGERRPGHRTGDAST